MMKTVDYKGARLAIRLRDKLLSLAVIEFIPRFRLIHHVFFRFPVKYFYFRQKFLPAASTLVYPGIKRSKSLVDLVRTGKSVV